MQELIAVAQAWAESDAPIIWLLGKTAAGKTSIVAELTGEAYDDIGQGFAPTTREARVYAFPAFQPVLRFLDTRGLGDLVRDDALADLTAAQSQAQLLLVVLRVDDLEQTEVLAALKAALRARPELRLIVAQTGLHRVYGRHDRHPDIDPFDGSDADGQRPGVPYELGRLLLAQRRLFRDLPGHRRPLFVPLDFTRPEMGIAPADFGVERLWEALHESVPALVADLEGAKRGALMGRIRTRLIPPWAVAAAATNALPVPVLGGLGSASLQAAMVQQIAGRFGFAPNLNLWREFVAALGTGFALGYGGRWLATQVLKLGLGWGTAVVSSWTFAITWGIGEAALYYFGERAAGHDPDPALLREHYSLGLHRARDEHAARKGRRP